MGGDSRAVDAFLHEALVGSQGGLDPEEVRAALTAFSQAIRRQAEALSIVKYKRRKAMVRVMCPKCREVSKNVRVTVPGVDPDVVARASAATGKAADTIARLQEFMAGKPDSRPADVGRDWLRGLTDEQVRIVQGWVEANGR